MYTSMDFNLFQINGSSIVLLGISFSTVAVLLLLLNKFIGHLLQKSRDLSSSFNTAYLKFKETFTKTLQQLETGDTDINGLLYGNFPSHDLAKRDFTNYLSGPRKKRFLRKWNEYKEMYYEIKALGPFGLVAAIAPSEEDISSATPADMERWELDRREKLHGIIHSLLNISKRNWWI